MQIGRRCAATDCKLRFAMGEAFGLIFILLTVYEPLNGLAATVRSGATARSTHELVLGLQAFVDAERSEQLSQRLIRTRRPSSALGVSDNRQPSSVLGLRYLRERMQPRAHIRTHARMRVHAHTRRAQTRA